MHIENWEACRSGAGITVTLEPNNTSMRRKQFVKRIVSENGSVTAFGADGARFPLNVGRETSADVAAIAGDLLNLKVSELIGLGSEEAHQLSAKVRAVAASSLGQRVPTDA